METGNEPVEGKILVRWCLDEVILLDVPFAYCIISEGGD